MYPSMLPQTVELISWQIESACLERLSCERRDVDSYSVATSETIATNDRHRVSGKNMLRPVGWPRVIRTITGQPVVGPRETRERETKRKFRVAAETFCRQWRAKEDRQSDAGEKKKAEGNRRG